jgi:methylmalonyl-CoA/ethylmalonyl-CoA epimerase
MLTAIDHTGIAVEDINASISYYRDVLKLPLVHRETVPEQGVDAVLFDVGDSHVELIAPLGPRSGVARFLEKRGPGLHHVAYRVDDIEAALTAFTEAGVRLIDATPRPVSAAAA